MSVAHILQSKGRSVSCINPQKTLAEAARMLAEHRIGVVLVTEPAETLIGILSERDIVRVVGLHGGSVLDQTVADHMTTRVVTCSEDNSVRDVMTMMTAGRFRHLPVLKLARLVGIISIGDVVKRRLEEFETEQQAMREYLALAS